MKTTIIYYQKKSFLFLFSFYNTYTFIKNCNKFSGDTNSNCSGTKSGKYNENDEENSFLLLNCKPGSSSSSSSSRNNRNSRTKLIYASSLLSTISSSSPLPSSSLTENQHQQQHPTCTSFQKIKCYDLRLLRNLSNNNNNINNDNYDNINNTESSCWFKSGKDYLRI